MAKKREIKKMVGKAVKASKPGKAVKTKFVSHPMPGSSVPRGVHEKP